MPRSREGFPAARPTLRAIAAQAGVSAMTVSRALRDHPGVAAEQRERITRLARQLGYRPDPEVARLMTHLRRRGKPRTVATLAALTSVPAGREPPFLLRAREAARDRAAELGYGFELFRIRDPEKPGRVLARTLLNRGIQGVLLLQLHTPLAVDNLLPWENFSAVSASPSVLGPAFPRVLADHFHNARSLAEALARRGRTRIGFVGPESFCLRTRHAFPAAIAWQALAGGNAMLPPFIHPGPIPDAAGCARWFQETKPDALVVHTAEAVPTLTALLGLPERSPVFFACTNVDPFAGRLAGIDERHDLIGSKAVDVLTGLLNRNEKNLRTSPVGTLIEGRWLEPGAAGRRDGFQG